MILHFLLAWLPLANATSYYIQPFSQFTHEASAIVHGTLGNIHAENGITSDGTKNIFTYATLDIKEVFKGDINTQSIVVREIGGTKDGYSVVIPGTPELKDGEDTVIFLGPKNNDETYDIHNLELGKFALENKNGEPTLSGGLFNFAKGDEHTAGAPIPENQHNWTLKELRETIEKQGGRTAPAIASSTPNGLPDKKALPNSDGSMSAADPKSPSTPLHESHTPAKEIPVAVSYGAFGLAAGFFMLFLFRKRR